MKFILSAYNYYPAHSGGTELYVSRLAEYLRRHGHEVLIIVAWDKSEPETTGEQEGIVKYRLYRWNEDNVLSVQFPDSSLESNYANYDPSWEVFFKTRLETLHWDNADYLLINGVNNVSGLALMRCLKNTSPGIKISVIHHTPFLCLKGDMFNAFTEMDCSEKVESTLCSRCYLKARTGLPDFLIPQMSSLLKYPGKLMPDRALFNMEKLFSISLTAVKALCTLADRFIVFSGGIRNFLVAQQWIDESKITVIMHGFDREMFQRGTSRIQVGSLNFTYAGRFEKVKGVDILARAWLGTRVEPDKRKLLLAGKWENTVTGRWIHGKLEKRKDVIFLGSLTQGELAEQFRQTDCVIIPSRWVETGPLVFHEAIGTGCHVISSDIGGQKELAEYYAPMATLFKNQNHLDLSKKIYQFQRSERKNISKGMDWDEHFELLLKSIYEN